jgi:hypothetical protein
MMINIFIDSTILAFPPREEDEEKDKTNIEKFCENIFDIYEFTENPNRRPNIAFFKEKGFDDRPTFRKFVYPSKSNADFEDQKKRIGRVGKIDHLHIDPKEIRRHLLKIFDWFDTPYGLEKRNGSRRGIRRAIEFKREDIEEIGENDKSECTVKLHYLRWPFFVNEYNKLFGYASRIQDKYDLKEWQIYARGNNHPGMISAKQFDKRYENHDKHFDTLKSALNKAKNEFSSEFIFSEEILNPKGSHPASIFDDPIYDMDFVPDRLFYYLEALDAAVKYIKMKDITSIKDKDLKEIIKIFGCDSVLDSMDYEGKNCYYRCWQVNGESNQNPFRLHLRPLTNVETGKKRLTMRVYCKWNSTQKKMAVMILKHPPECNEEECDRYKECNPQTVSQ